MAANVCQAVDNLVAAHHVVVFSKSWCPYSRMAKEALANYKIDDLHVGASTVPRVFINGSFVGGGEDTVRMHKSGELAKLLKQ